MIATHPGVELMTTWIESPLPVVLPSCPAESGMGVNSDLCPLRLCIVQVRTNVAVGH